MKLDLKGLHKVSRRLVSGEVSVHYYAWRGGPKITAKPGTPAFVAEFTAVTAERDKPDHFANTFQTLINGYQQDPEFLKLKEITRKGYIQRIRHIEAKFGKMPITVLNDPRIRGDFLAWRTKAAKESGPREADYRIAVLARILSWAHHHRKISEQHLKDPKRIHSGTRVEMIWKDDDIVRFRKVAPDHIDLPFTLGIETGQRQRDILNLTWADYTGTHLQLKQSKRGRNVSVALLSETLTRLDRLREGKKPSDRICVNSEGKPWTSDGFRTSFGKAKAKAGIANLTFHDTRGTAVVKLARAGSTVPEIASITGHSLRDAETILSKHYLGSDRHLGDNGIRKLEHQRATERANEGQ